METKGSQAYGSQAYGSQIYVNGKVVRDEMIKAEYDGKNLAVDIYDNGKHFYSKLNNNDIANILSHRASALPLEKRLMKDFSIKKKSTKKKNKRKTYKKR
jgi:hypothetical protein